MCCLWLLKSLGVYPLHSPSRSDAEGSLRYTENISSHEPRQCPPLPEPAAPALRLSCLAVPVFIRSPDNLVISVANKDATVDLAEYFHRELFGIVGTGAIAAFLRSGTVCCGGLAGCLCLCGRGILPEPWTSPLSVFRGNKDGLGGWAFCLITGSYLEVCGLAGLLPIEFQVSTDVWYRLHVSSERFLSSVISLVFLVL